MLAIAQAESGVPYWLGHRISIRPVSGIGFDDSGFDCSGVVAGVVECHRVGLRCVVVYVHCSRSPFAVNPTSAVAT